MAVVKPDDSLKAFRQHGFVQSEMSGRTQSVGNCIFCGKDKFFINIESKAWDCKVCGKKGGYQVFLQELVDWAKGHFKGTKAIALARARGIAIATLQRRGVGYNPVNDSYLIPVPDMNGEKMWNVLKYRFGEKLMQTSGCTGGLYGWEAVSQDHDTIWLCEGEWDGMAMMEILEKNQATEKAIVLAVPGGNTFKADWVTIFREKKVRVLYDHDRTGLEGSLKVSVSPLAFGYRGQVRCPGPLYQAGEGKRINDLRLDQCKPARNAPGRYGGGLGKDAGQSSDKEGRVYRPWD
jgi:hypothetical protein